MPSRYRVAAGWLIGVVFVVLTRPTLTSIALGFPLVLLGEAIRIWASGHIEKTKILATGGPYAHCRHPLYVGSLLIALGAAVAGLVLVLAVGGLCRTALRSSSSSESADIRRAQVSSLAVIGRDV